MISWLAALSLLVPPLLLVGWLWWGWRRVAALRALTLTGIDRLDGTAFELLVAQLLRRDGYAVRHTGKTGDMGADLLAGDYAIQCKRYAKPVGSSAIQEAHTAATAYGKRYGVVVTTSGFTRAAKKLARLVGVQLVNRASLADWLQGRSVL